VTLPFPLAKLKGAMLQLLPNPPLTLDQVRLLEKNNVVSEVAKRDHRTLEGLGIVDPVAVEAVVPD
ncbi:MAG TPA: complex I NDUFA9 subunit family protein, partial [Methyloceanibacter sp.]